eukprot:TRINITY_DN3074_c1_g1_i1.p2 TRINITY_DN3074_c1_g1~~TRINITY_DN3074_c1_g1_i1.p2  ORF type:complete len:207 (+),score=63.76 TRINITY_DN3074_c1_g1_i1:76-696(+)
MAAPPQQLYLHCECFPAVAGMYTQRGEWCGRPVWIGGGDSEMPHCIYAGKEGEEFSWLVGPHGEEHMSRRRAALQSAPSDTATPHHVSGWLRAAEADDGSVQQVVDSQIVAVGIEPDEEASGPPVTFIKAVLRNEARPGMKVTLLGAASLEMLCDACELPPERVLPAAGQPATVVGLRAGSYAALVELRLASGDVEALPMGSFTLG